MIMLKPQKSVLKALKIWNKEFDKIYMYEVNCPITPILVNSFKYNG